MNLAGKVVLATLTVAAFAFAVVATTQNRQLRETCRQVEAERDRLSRSCDSLRVARVHAADSLYRRVQEVCESLRAYRGAVEAEWHRKIQEARGTRGMLLEDYEIGQLKKDGLLDPVNQLADDLSAHPELIPFKGILGGTMGFGGDISLLNRRWVYAEFADGHYGGSCLLEYKVSPAGEISWSVDQGRGGSVVLGIGLTSCFSSPRHGTPPLRGKSERFSVGRGS